MLVHLGPLPQMEPLGSRRSIYAYPIAGKPLYDHLLQRAADSARGGGLRIVVDDPLLLERAEAVRAISRYGEVVTPPACDAEELSPSPFFPTAEGDRIDIVYPWHLLDVLAEVVGHMTPAVAPDAAIEDDVEISGNVVLESGVRVLGGTRIKGNVYVGPGSTIGNSAMLRGDVSLGPNSLVGFSGEVKNSLMLERALVGPVTTVHETVAEEDCFVGGTTRVSNYRLDGKEVEVLVDGVPVSTGRRQFGTILGAGVKFGGACLILPGRKIGAGCEIGPHVVVTRNLPPGKRVTLKQALVISDL